MIVVTGAAVRLTNSGLGCPDWPRCEGEQLFASPDDFHGMVENVNRLFTGVVAAAVMAAVLGSLVRIPRRRDLTWLSLGLVAGVIAQIIWGAFTVWSELRPEFVMGHYLISAVLVANAVVLVQRASSGGRPLRHRVPPTTVWLSRAMVAVAAVVIVSGTIVTNTGPHAGDDRAVRFGFEIANVARIHAVSVLCLLLLTIATLAGIHRAGGAAWLGRRGVLLVASIVAQGALGYWQYFTGVPALLVGFHVAGSVLVWIAVLAVHLSIVDRPPLESSAEGSRSTAGGELDSPHVAATGPAITAGGGG